MYCCPRKSLLPKLYFADAGLRNLAMGNLSDLDTRADIGQIIEVKSGFMKRIAISRGLRSFLVKYKPERAILLNNNLWQRETEEDCVVEALPTALFLLGPLSNRDRP